MRGDTGIGGEKNEVKKEANKRRNVRGNTQNLEFEVRKIRQRE